MAEPISIPAHSLLLNGTLEGTGLEETRPLSEAIDGLRHERSMDRICQAATALAEAAVRSLPPDQRRETGVFLGSGFGTYASNLDHLTTLRAGEPLSPAVFSWTQPNIPTAWISISLGLAGMMLTRSDGVLGGAKAVACAADFLKARMAGSLLTGGVGPCDERIHDAVASAAGELNPARFEGGGFLLLATGSRPEKVPVLESWEEIYGSDWRSVASQPGRWEGADLVVLCRPRMAEGLPAGIEHFDLGAHAGDLLEGAGPAGLALAVSAVRTGRLGSAKLPARPRGVWVADTDLCGKETVLFRIEEP